MVAIHLRPRSTTTATSRSDIVNGWRDWCAEGGMPYRRCHKQDRHREIVRAAFPSGEGFAGEDSKEPRLHHEMSTVFAAWMRVRSRLDSPLKYRTKRPS